MGRHSDALRERIRADVMLTKIMHYLLFKCTPQKDLLDSFRQSPIGK